MAPKYVDKNKKQIEIIKDSYSFFIKEGLNNSSMDKLLFQLKMAKGTFYHYFPSKAELLKKLFAFFTKEYIRKKEKELQNINDFEEKLFSLFDIYLDDSITNKEFLKLYYEYIFSSSLEKKSFELEYQEFVKRVLKEIFLEEINKKALKKEALVFCETIIYTLDGFLLHSYYLEDYSLEKELKNYLKNLLVILKEKNEIK